MTGKRRYLQSPFIVILKAHVLCGPKDVPCNRVEQAFIFEDLHSRQPAEVRSEPRNQFGARQTEMLMDARQHARLKLNTDVKIYSRTSSRIMGRTVDISESGLAAMLKIEVPLDQVVRLEFELPLGPVSLRALVRQKNAFRYGFQFVEPHSDAQELIRRFCRDLPLRP